MIVNSDLSPASHLVQIVIRGLKQGKAVELDGLGTFYPDALRGFRFQPQPPQVFVAYVKEDRDDAGRLCDALGNAGFRTWLDERNLIAGQNWPRAIESAIETSDYFVACFSTQSVDKRGGFQAEIRYALDCARRLPLDEIFLLPVRLNLCRLPRSIARELQYVDLFPNWDSGVRRLIATMQRRARLPS